MKSSGDDLHDDEGWGGTSIPNAPFSLRASFTQSTLQAASGGRAARNLPLAWPADEHAVPAGDAAESDASTSMTSANLAGLVGSGAILVSSAYQTKHALTARRAGIQIH
jgi:hypothetical protein